MKTILAIATVATALSFSTAFAGQVAVIDVKADKTGERIYRFSVTLQHADEGWEHYANKWEIVAPDGTVLAERVLAHPHVEEQAFTRSLSGVVIPEGISHIIVRGRDSIHGLGDTEMKMRID
jgi:hypothetical protein